jgi:hypothetical protein
VSVHVDTDNMVFQLARVGLAAFAQNQQNPPAAIAVAANHLEAWRADCELRHKMDAQIAVLTAQAEPKP